MNFFKEQKKYKIINLNNLEQQVEKLSARSGGRSLVYLFNYNGKSFYYTYFRAKKTGEATSKTLHKLAEIGIDMKQILSKDDYNFIFG